MIVVKCKKFLSKAEVIEQEKIKVAVNSIEIG